MYQPTTEMRFPVNLTVEASSTVTTPWFYIHGYDKVEFLGWWTGNITGTATLQATNAPVDPVQQNSSFQPNPSAVEIVDLDTFTNVAPAGAASTAGARDTFENVLAMWVRISFAETGAVSGTLQGDLTAKSSS